MLIIHANPHNMIRHDISQLRKNRSIHLKLGFIIAISLVTLAFNYTSELPAPYEIEAIAEQEDGFIPVVPVTRDVKKKLPPPVVKVTNNFMPDDTEFTNEPKLMETTIDAKPTETPLPAPPSKPAITPTPTPPPVEDDPVSDIPEVFDVVEHMPLFGDCSTGGLSKAEKQHCSAVAIIKYMGKHIKYPAMAREHGIEGTVVIRFVVDEHGNISNPEIVKDIGGGCGKEALRVVKKMPQWEPGRQRDRKVKVYFNLPVKFKLS